MTSASVCSWPRPAVRGNAAVALSDNEYKTAERLKQDYWLYVAFNCGTKPELHLIHDPARLGWQPVVQVAHYHLGSDAILKAETALITELQTAASAIGLQIAGLRQRAGPKVGVSTSTSRVTPRISITTKNPTLPTVSPIFTGHLWIKTSEIPA